MTEPEPTTEAILACFDPMPIQSREDVAFALGVSEETVQARLLSLQREGLVMVYDLGDPCRGRTCAECGACAELSLKLAFWQITPGGRKMLNDPTI